jgi:epoxyqueuosine reductase
MPADPHGDLAREVERVGRAAGLTAVGIAPATPLVRARQALEDRRSAGLHGGMAFTYRNPARSTTPSRTLPSARSIVVGARRYRSAPPPRPAGSLGTLAAAGTAPVGRVARYAWRDEYAILRDGLGAIAARLRADGHKALVLADDNALVDREVAHRAGLGWFGKNANLLLPGEGSWFVLGSVLTSAALPAAPEVVADGCGACRRCMDACPTEAIVAPGVVDARRCLAWLVQRGGVFPREYRVALGDRIYGCDDCQEVCPPNVRVDRRQRPITDGSSPDALDAWVPLLEVLDADDATLLVRYGRWYIADRQPRWLRRNALIALGNVGDPGDPVVEATLARYLADTDPVLRAHAVWAARRLGRNDLLDRVMADDAPDVLDELAAPAPEPRGHRSARR